jgi:hypothetical protein
MILGENENPNIWKKNIYDSLKNLSDIELQKLTWLGKHPKYISSFTEIISVLYDDFDFERYIQYYESKYGMDDLYKSFCELNNSINSYQELESDELILKDPNWIKITKKAKEIVQSIKAT